MKEAKVKSRQHVKAGKLSVLLRRIRKAKKKKEERRITS
jgi:hypothetical protein